MVTAKDIKELRAGTGAGIADVKKALEESGGDIAKAVRWLERKLGSAALKKVSRDTNAGLVETYIHSNGKIGSMIEIYCETDFVSRNPEFKELAHDLAMHVAAMNPKFISLDSVPEDIKKEEEARFQEEVKSLDKPEAMKKEIVKGKLESYLGAHALLSQSFVKDQNKTVGEYVNEAIGRFGENIKIGKFARFEI